MHISSSEQLKDIISDWADLKVKSFENRRSWVRKPEKNNKNANINQYANQSVDAQQFKRAGQSKKGRQRGRGRPPNRKRKGTQG